MVCLGFRTSHRTICAATASMRTTSLSLKVFRTWHRNTRGIKFHRAAAMENRLEPPSWASHRLFWVVVAVLIGAVAAAAPSLLRRNSAQQAAAARTGPAVGM